MIYRLLCFQTVHKTFNIYQSVGAEFGDQVKKLWGVDKNISFAKKTNADKWI